MAVALVAQTEDVVGEGCHGEVVGADDSLVIVGECYAPNLCKDSALGVHTNPPLVESECHVAVAAPDTNILYHGARLKQR